MAYTEEKIGGKKAPPSKHGKEVDEQLEGFTG